MNFELVNFHTSCGNASQLPVVDRPEIIFSGRSNVGKSSLINKLCNRKNLARTSSAPGKTATINFFNCDGTYLVDLPGYGYAKVSHSERQRWDKLINSYFQQERAGALLLQLLDCRHAISKDDETMLEYISHYQIPFIAVLTKVDKLKKSEIPVQQKYFTELLAPYETCQGFIFTSTSSKAGIADVQSAIEAYAQIAFEAFEEFDGEE